MPLSDTQTLGIGSALGYEILGVEFDNQPTGYTTYIGISTGAWFKNNAAFIGAGATEYRVTLNNISDFQELQLAMLLNWLITLYHQVSLLRNLPFHKNSLLTLQLSS